MPFELQNTRVLYEGRHVKLWGRKFLDKGGNPREWEYIEKKDAVLVLPITEDGKAVLVKSYRVPIEGYVLETPAGLMDCEGESCEDAIRRELMEETGYRASGIVPLPPWPYRAGSSKNLIYGFIATGLEKVSDAVGDDTEDISVVEIPLDDLLDVWLHPEENPEAKVYFQPEIIAMHLAAIALGIVS